MEKLFHYYLLQILIHVNCLPQRIEKSDKNHWLVAVDSPAISVISMQSEGYMLLWSPFTPLLVKLDLK